MRAGIEWLIDAHGCDPGRLQSLDGLQRVCQRVVDDLALRVVGQPHWHKFPGPGGVTGLYLLSESHLACHTYPEVGLATFNLYCCRERPVWNWEGELAELLAARSVDVRMFPRGVVVESTGGDRLRPAAPVSRAPAAGRRKGSPR